jgi:hypothetical protein
MRYRLALFVAIVMLVLIGTARPVGAQATFSNLKTKLEFPERLSFSATIEASNEIERVVLEYGTNTRSCANVIAKAYPEISPATKLNVSWTWEMLRSGSEPPGAQIWYRWRAIDVTGKEYVSEQQELTWIDTKRRWQSKTRGLVTLHWYAGSERFADELLDSAEEALQRLANDTKVLLNEPTDIYIYANTEDMREAILYEPSWTGGLAFPAQHIVIIGIAPQQMEWGKRTVGHELTHILIGDLAFSCIGSVPTWLNEGIAMYAEGDLEPGYQQILQQAIATNDLISLRSLNSNFSEQSNKAQLSYAQSYSIVAYLIQNYSQDQLLALFAALRDGQTTEAALQQVYQRDLDTLEAEWRRWIGAGASNVARPSPTPNLQPTIVPTYPPVIVESYPTQTPDPRRPTSTPIAVGQADQDEPTRTPASSGRATRSDPNQNRPTATVPSQAPADSNGDSGFLLAGSMRILLAVGICLMAASLIGGCIVVWMLLREKKQ